MKKHIPSLLESIQNLETGQNEIEVIFRDNNSSDGSPQEVEKKYPWVNLIKGDRDIGFSRSNNIMFEHSTGEVICCVNLDTILDRRFLVEGLAILGKNPGIAGVNTNMIMPWIMPFDEFLNTDRDKLPVYEFQLTRYGFVQYVSVEPVEHETNFMTGGGFFLRRSALRDGETLFDPEISTYCEDTELSMRLKKRGDVLVYSPKAVIFHNQDPKKLEIFTGFRKLFIITWNRFYVLSKYYQTGNFLKHYPLFVWGIIKKMNFLGLPLIKKLQAYLAGGVIAVSFLLLFPCWIYSSIKFTRR